jgi:DNA invertase Pin-like site-specific DNA recombinase
LPEIGGVNQPCHRVLQRSAAWDICSLVFHVFAALAEFERDLIPERTTAGLAAARARGRRGGRPSVLSGRKLRVAEEMYRSGQYTVAAIATTLGVSRASIYRHLTGSRS